MKRRYRISTDGPEMDHLLDWLGLTPASMAFMEMLDLEKQQKIIDKELADFGGKWTETGYFTFATEEDMMAFRMKWG